MSAPRTEARLVVVNGGLGNPSSTGLLARQLADATVQALAGLDVTVRVTTVDLRPLAHPLADALLTGFPSGDLAEALEQVAGADAVVAVTPVFQASYAGLFKTFFDVLEPEALVGTPVLLGATAGSARHSLVLEHAMRPLFAHLKALTLPTAVFAASEDFGSTADGVLEARVQRAGRELAQLVAGRPGRAEGRVQPAAARPAAPRELPDPTPFAEVLARL